MMLFVKNEKQQEAKKLIHSECKNKHGNIGLILEIVLLFYIDIYVDIYFHNKIIRNAKTDHNFKFKHLQH